MYSPIILTTLAQLYHTYDIPVDRLATSTHDLDCFTHDLNSRAGCKFSSQDTARALLYARKTSRLPRLRRKAR